MTQHSLDLEPEAAAICKWCNTDAATTVVYGWPTCVVCAADRQTRVRRWLIDLNPWGTNRENR